jgi:phage-related protein
MAGSRTLKLSILADVDDLRKKLGEGSTEVQGFGDKVTDFGKKAGLAFAAAGAAAAVYAGKLLVDGVKSAIEDEAAQAKLAGTLERVAGATKETVAGVENYITKTSLAVGITDDQLRPAFDRLVRSTGDVSKAQQALDLALNISAATGKSLETVTAAVGKALDGNATSLGKVAGGFEASELKGKSFSELLPILTERFGGAAQEQAETFAGKMDRLGIAFSEAKETVGSFVLDAITPLVTNFVDNVIPAISTVATDIGEKLQPVFSDISVFISETVVPTLKALWKFLNETLVPILSGVFLTALRGIRDVFGVVATKIKENEDNFKEYYKAAKPVIDWLVEKVAPLLKNVVAVAFKAIGTGLGVAIDAFGLLAGAIGRAVNGIRDLINLVKNNPVVKGISGVIDTVFGGGRASGGSVNAGTSYLVGEQGAELFVPKTNGTIIPNDRLGGGSSVTNININVTGALDREGVARQIVDLLNDSFYRGTIAAATLKV